MLKIANWPNASLLKLPKKFWFSGLPNGNGPTCPLNVPLELPPELELLVDGPPYWKVFALVELPTVPDQLMPYDCFGLAVISTNLASIITCLVGRSI